MAIGSEQAASPQGVDAPAAFRTILCGIDGSRAAAFAADDAIAMADPDGHVAFITCPWRVGRGLVEKATLDPGRATKATDAALKAARVAGVDASVEVVAASDPTPVLLERGAAYDLLVLGSHGGSRAAGIALGSTASAALHRAAVPVLVSRRPSDRRPLLENVLVAVDGTLVSEHVVDVARRLLPRAGRLTLIHAGGDDEARQRAARQYADLGGGDDERVRWSSPDGAAQDEIERTARADGATLVVLGSRGLHGLRALGSVSERVAHRVPCGVLVVRPPGD